MPPINRHGHKTLQDLGIAESGLRGFQSGGLFDYSPRLGGKPEPRPATFTSVRPRPRSPLKVTSSSPDWNPRPRPTPLSGPHAVGNPLRSSARSAAHQVAALTRIAGGVVVSGRLAQKAGPPGETARAASVSWDLMFRCRQPPLESGVSVPCLWPTCRPPPKVSGNVANRSWQVPLGSSAACSRKGFCTCTRPPR